MQQQASGHAAPEVRRHQRLLHLEAEQLAAHAPDVPTELFGVERDLDDQRASYRHQNLAGLQTATYPPRRTRPPDSTTSNCSLRESLDLTPTSSELPPLGVSRRVVAHRPRARSRRATSSTNAVSEA